MSIARRAARSFAWQGWRLDRLPRGWDPVQLSGTAAAGHALFADGVRPRLGLQWRTPGRRADPAAVVAKAMAGEVGTLAATEAVPFDVAGDWTSPLLYVEPDPPGRDVWVGHSQLSGRVLTVVYHARRRDRALANVLLPSLSEADLERAAPWSVFDLSLLVPGEMALTAQRLNAGDLSLIFADRRRATLSVRQIAVAELALRRRPLDGWIAEQRKSLERVYRPAGPAIDVTVPIGGRDAIGRSARLVRRRRFMLATWHPPSVVTLALHDTARDRLVILHGTDADLLTVVATTVGKLPDI